MIFVWNFVRSDNIALYQIKQVSRIDFNVKNHSWIWSRTKQLLNSIFFTILPPVCVQCLLLSDAFCPSTIGYFAVRLKCSSTRHIFVALMIFAVAIDFMKPCLKYAYAKYLVSSVCNAILFYCCCWVEWLFEIFDKWHTNVQSRSICHDV